MSSVWVIYGPSYNISVREVKHGDYRQDEDADSHAYWCKVGESYPQFIKGKNMFFTEEEAVLRLLTDQAEKRDELNQAIEKLRKRYHTLTKPKMGIKIGRLTDDTTLR